MALQLGEYLKDSIFDCTGLSPKTFFTVVALGLALYYVVSGVFSSPDHVHHQRSRNLEEQMESLPPPVQLGEISEEELKQYDGSDPKKPLLMAIKGQIYGVSQSRSRNLEEKMESLPPPVQLGEISEEELKQYDGSDPKKPLLMAIKGQIYDVSQSRMFYGPYSLFAGKDASRALAKLSFEDKDRNGDISGLGAFQLDALQDWEYKFMSKYVKFGTVKMTVVPVSDGTANIEHVEANNHDAKPAEGGASESVKPSENADLCNEASSDSIPAETGNKFDGDADKQE